MTFVVGVTLLILLGVLVLRLWSVSRSEGLQIVVWSICAFVLGYEVIGGSLGRIPSLDHYLLIHGFIDTWREEAIYFVPGALLGAIWFAWMLRRHLTKRWSEPPTGKKLIFDD